MKNKTILPLLFFTLTIAAALYFLPSTAAQTEEITDGLTNLWGTLSALPTQAISYVSEHPAETVAVATPTALAGGLGLAYKSANAAKNKLQSALTTVTGENGVLSELKNKAESTLTSVTSQAEKEITSYKQQAETATGQLTGLQTEVEQAKSKVFDVEKQKAAAFNEIDQLKAQLKTAQDQLKVLTPQVK
jgi:peptidoglycan hydrolase CwlO-like protein